LPQYDERTESTIIVVAVMVVDIVSVIAGAVVDRVVNGVYVVIAVDSVAGIAGAVVDRVINGVYVVIVAADVINDVAMYC